MASTDRSHYQHDSIPQQAEMLDVINQADEDVLDQNRSKFSVARSYNKQNLTQVMEKMRYNKGKYLMKKRPN